MKGVYWTGNSKEAPYDGRPVKQDGVYDLIVVGGGYCGLSIALNAAQLGLSVALLEAGIIGCGASGRNGGIVVPSLPGAKTTDDLLPFIGSSRADKLAQLVADGPATLFRLIDEHQILCDLDKTGWLQPAHSEQALLKAKRAFEFWRGRGAPVKWLGAGDIREKTGAPGYLGGWYSPNGGVINAYALAQGMARAAADAGAAIFQHEEVLSVARSEGAKVVKTARAAFKAKKVVFATNGHTPNVYAGLTQSVIPVRLFQCITRPLTEHERTQILPSRIPFTDLRKSGGFARLDAEHRLFSGGAVFTASNQSYGVRHSALRVSQLFPQLGPVEFEHYWEGYCALTDAGIPAIQTLEEDVYSVVGFSTRGIALANTLGREFAQLLAEVKSESDMPVRVGSIQKIFMQPIKTFLGGYAFPVYKARDRLKMS